MGSSSVNKTVQRAAGIALAVPTLGASVAVQRAHERQQNARRAGTRAAGDLQQSAEKAETQTNIAEDERLRRLRLQQLGTQASSIEASTGRSTLLGG